MSNSIVCVHLLDDFSGSAKVFAQAISVLKEAGFSMHVIIGSHGNDGFIRSGNRVQLVPYRFHHNKLRLLLEFILVQFNIFKKVRYLLNHSQYSAVYVNTVLPVGAMLAGIISRKPVITHIHEVGLGSRLLFRILLEITIRSSNQLIVVSNYVYRFLELPLEATSVVHNSLSPNEWRISTHISESSKSKALALRSGQSFRVVMACSLKWYKGVDSFLELAKQAQISDDPALQRMSFELILNCELEDFNDFRKEIGQLINLNIVHRPNSVFAHYQNAHILLNLSLPEWCIETFGMTLLEAMACGVPVVSPKIGGCTEIFAHGEGGWRIDGHDLPALLALLKQLANDPLRWEQASQLAIEAAACFSSDVFSRKIMNIFKSQL